MPVSDLIFGLWWYCVCGALGAAAWLSSRRSEPGAWSHVLRTFLIGVAAGLALYLAPGGVDAVRSTQDFETRFICALAIAWLAGEWMTRRGEEEHGLSTVAVAGFAGVNLPPLAFLASVYMVSGGNPLGA